MRKYSFILAAVAASVFAVSCAKEDVASMEEEELIEQEEPAFTTVRFTVTAETPDTKTVITGDGTNFTPSWQGNESMEFWPIISKDVDDTSGGSVHGPLENTVSGNKATFTGAISIPDGWEGEHNIDQQIYAGVVPASAAVGAETSGYYKKVTVNLPVVQEYNPSVSFIDPAADILFCRGYRDKEDIDTDVSPFIDVTFVREVALVKVNVKVGNVLARIGGATKVQSLAITSSSGIAGSYQLSSRDWEIVSTPTQNTVTVTPAVAEEFNGENVASVYLALARVDIPAASTLRFVVTTDKGIITAERTLPVDILLSKGKANINLNVNAGDDIVLDGYKHVTFNSQGGSFITTQNVTSGDVAVAPSVPTKTIALAQGLYSGKYLNPDAVPVSFDGWYSDSGCTMLYNFSTPVTTDITLYAKWGTGPVKKEFSGAEYTYTYNDIQRSVIYINGHDAEEYTLVIAGLINNPSIGTLNKYNAELNIVGVGSMREIWPGDEGGRVFNISNGTVRLGKNITVTKKSDVTTYGRSIVNLSAANGVGNHAVFEMLEGSVITGISTSADAIIKINGGNNSFRMSGGEISSNSVTSSATCAATVLDLYGKFQLSGGEIKNNTVVVSSESAVAAGGILLNSAWLENCDDTGAASNKNKTEFVGTGFSGNTASSSAVLPGKLANHCLLVKDNRETLDKSIPVGTNIANIYDAAWWKTAD